MAVLRDVSRRLAVACLLVVSGWIAGADAAGSPAPRAAGEYQVKAALIINLARFVEWPATAFADASARFNVCVIGVDPFGPALESVTEGRAVSGHPIAVRRLVAFEPGCHVLFVSASEARRVPVILDQIRGQSVLSVGDDRDFLTQGGIVAFFKRGENVRFDISAEAAEGARLKVSARVMALVDRSTGATP